MQVIRSLAFQSARYCVHKNRSWPWYCIAVSDSEEKNSLPKKISQNSVNALEKMVYDAIRSDSVNFAPAKNKTPNSVLKDCDTSYGGRLLISLAKRIGLIIPRKGKGARFVLIEKLLRLLVLTTVPVKGRLTFDQFKDQLQKCHGLVFDANGFRNASRQRGAHRPQLDNHIDNWLQNMLEAAGFLIRLSDSVSIVKHPVQD